MVVTPVPVSLLVVAVQLTEVSIFPVLFIHPVSIGMFFLLVPLVVLLPLTVVVPVRVVLCRSDACGR